MKVANLLFIAAIALASTAKAQTADEIIDKNIAAMGGADNWAKITSLKMTGSLSAQGMEMTMTQTLLKDKGMRQDISVMGNSGYTIITPDGAWAFQPGMDKPTQLPKEMIGDTKSKLKVAGGFVMEKDKIKKAESKGVDTINGVACFKVKVTDKDDNEETAYFDPQTFYVVRLEVNAKMQGEEQEVALNFADYQKQPEGIVYPMSLGMSMGDIKIKSLELNKPVDESIFKVASK